MKTSLVLVLLFSVSSVFAQRVKENVKVRQGTYEESKKEVKVIKEKTQKKGK